MERVCGEDECVGAVAWRTGQGEGCVNSDAQDLATSVRTNGGR